MKGFSFWFETYGETILLVSFVYLLMNMVGAAFNGWVVCNYFNVFGEGLLELVLVLLAVPAIVYYYIKK